jgi:phosphomevalonate kinase
LRNPFVETALSYALSYVSSVLPSTIIKPATVTILADNDYYSQPSGNTTIDPNSSAQFINFGVRLQDAHKTGLGSSAALVTAFTGAILSHYLPPSQFTLSSPEGRAKLHNLAQAAHCAAQGKVGSGFDVAAAVYGTCVYRRFSPSLLSALGDPGSPGFATRVRQVVDDSDPERKWDTEVEKKGVAIPQGMALVMCDVDCGSQTVGMVKQVLAWRKSDPDGSKRLWDQLQIYNDVLGKTLSEGQVGDLEAAFADVREKIREMGKLSGVPIEPQEQTDLLDALTGNVAGVAGGVVPGAGGYDALALLVKDDKETMDDLKAFLVQWSAERRGNVKLLSAKGELEGARERSASVYSGFG